MKNNLLIIGAGGHAVSCIDVIELENKYKIVGIVTNDKIKNLFQYKIIGNDNDLSNLRLKIDFAFIGIGQIKSSETKKSIFHLLKKLKFKLPTIISPRSYISKRSKILEGSIIMHNAIVNANASVGKNCIINNNANIEHDAVINDHCHISTGAIINGNCVIGKNSFIGSNSTLHHGITILPNSIIPAGSLISKNN